MGFFDALKKYPIKVTILTKYGDTIAPHFDKGRYEKQRIKTADGFIENNYLMLKKTKVKLPAPEISFYFEHEGIRHLWLLQIDRSTFYPISFKKEGIFVKYKAYATDEQGKPIIDEHGKPKMVIAERKFFDASIAFDDGTVIELPNPVAHRTYDKEHWLSDEIETSSRLYRSKGLWEKYGNLIILGVVGIVVVMALYVGAKNITDMATAVGNNLEAVAKSCGYVPAAAATQAPPPF